MSVHTLHNTGMMVSGFVLRTTGWKVMVAIMTGHMALYLYEVGVQVCSSIIRLTFSVTLLTDGFF